MYPHQLHVAGEAFVQPDVIPPAWRHQIAKPLQDDLSMVVVCSDLLELFHVNFITYFITFSVLHDIVCYK